jgi:hypothetical protein
MKFMVRKFIILSCPVEAENEHRAIELAAQMPSNAWSLSGEAEFDIDYPATAKLRDENDTTQSP